MQTGVPEKGRSRPFIACSGPISTPPEKGPIGAAPRYAHPFAVPSEHHPVGAAAGSQGQIRRLHEQRVVRTPRLVAISARPHRIPAVKSGSRTKTALAVTG